MGDVMVGVEEAGDTVSVKPEVKEEPLDGGYEVSYPFFSQFVFSTVFSSFSGS